MRRVRSLGVAVRGVIVENKSGRSALLAKVEAQTRAETDRSRAGR